MISAESLRLLIFGAVVTFVSANFTVSVNSTEKNVGINQTHTISSSACTKQSVNSTEKHGGINQTHTTSACTKQSVNSTEKHVGINETNTMSILANRTTNSTDQNDRMDARSMFFKKQNASLNVPVKPKSPEEEMLEYPIGDCEVLITEMLNRYYMEDLTTLEVTVGDIFNFTFEPHDTAGNFSSVNHIAIRQHYFNQSDKYHFILKHMKKNAFEVVQVLPVNYQKSGCIRTLHTSMRHWIRGYCTELTLRDINMTVVPLNHFKKILLHGVMIQHEGDSYGAPGVGILLTIYFRILHPEKPANKTSDDEMVVTYIPRKMDRAKILQQSAIMNKILRRAGITEVPHDRPPHHDATTHHESTPHDTTTVPYAESVEILDEMPKTTPRRPVIIDHE